MFEVHGSGPNIKVCVAKQPESRPVGAAEKQPRAIEVDPRAPYRRFPNDQRVEYGPNPARIGTPRYRRYENYKTATTIGGARRMGSTSQDISLDIQAGALRLL